ncbi:formate dehydrogenase accessory sulfurtransferase FdhD [Pseudovibrio exalbescens]|uniref:formate dehydrogenase accessory sulfurtransferase FdhD n=1 Tax=Pseudovibrio exalbescens TaxID=197461 RepID=UPI0023657DFD|nr:formate dehydrogenase accessory sulfurtransferase FdhD [Pseudovibrio exalbescens]MDD7911324.1 formate dehydrogenase accessory sulfurtransferase FdhD [Pseudovibrio exalbescens]
MTGHHVHTPEEAKACGLTLAPEAPVAFTLNGEGFAVLMATPQDLEDFAIGFAVSEGILPSAADLAAVHLQAHDALGFTVDLQIDDDRFFEALRRRRMLTGTAGCGLCGVDSLSAAMRPLTPLQGTDQPEDDRIQEALRTLTERQHLSDTYGGGLHAAVAALANGEYAVREDIGRHNALDKALGAGLKTGVAIDFVMTTSRCSADLVQKTVTCGVPSLVVMASPSDLAVKLSENANLNLLSCQRGHGIICYTQAK